jgi:glucuronoarabinoxylan endo-1,4-beta-xylanase
VEATSRPAANVHVTAYKSDGKVVIVVINRRKSQVDLEFTLENGETAEFLSWMTTAEDNIAPGPAFTVTGGSFRTRLQAQSVTTFVGELSY